MRVKQYIYLIIGLFILAASAVWGEAPNLPPTRPLWDSNKLITNHNKPLITFNRAQDPEGNPIRYTVKISNAATAESFTFAASAESIVFRPADPLPDATYDLTLTASDGTAEATAYYALALTIDSGSPEVTSISIGNVMLPADTPKTFSEIPENKASYLPKVGIGTGQLEIIFNEPINPDIITLKIISTCKPQHLLAANWVWENDQRLAVTFDITERATSDAYSIVIEAKDRAGNILKQDKRFRFQVDTVPPPITLSQPKDREMLKSSPVYFKGSVSESNVTLSINDKPVLLDQNGLFNYPLALSDGENDITIIGTDEAGNVSALNYILYYQSVVPKLEVKKPLKDAWFAAGSTIAVAIAVVDNANAIKGQTEAQAKYQDQTIPADLCYEKDTAEISGFVTLPDNLPHGTNELAISITDSAGNIGSAKLLLQIDRKCPMLSLKGLQNAAWSNDVCRILIPINDEESGLSLNGINATLFQLSATIEGTIQQDGTALYFIPKAPLSEGVYNLQFTARDRAGNGTAAYTVSVNIDTTAPQIEISSPADYDIDQATLTLAGNIKEQKIANINYSLNGGKSEALELQNNTFSRTLFLDKYDNSITITAQDEAGNLATKSITVHTTQPLASDDLVVTNLLPHPAPFKPGSGNLTFYYTLSKAARVNLYLFDLNGTVLWKKDIAADPGSGNTGDRDQAVSWDGLTDLGEYLSNGVYLLQMVAQDTAGHIVKTRTKVIVLR